MKLPQMDKSAYLESQLSSTKEFTMGSAEVRLTPEEEAACWALTRALFALPRTMDSALERVAGLTLAEYSVLTAVATSVEGAMRITDLATWMSMTASGLTRLVDRLIDLGFAARKRSPFDRRSWLVSLTDEGTRMTAVGKEAFQSCLQRVFLHNLGGLELIALTAAFEAILSDTNDRQLMALPRVDSEGEPRGRETTKPAAGAGLRRSWPAAR
jgi:DNA-binding MarR family transcriptional regulator